MKIDGKNYIAMSEVVALQLNTKIEKQKQKLAEVTEELVQYKSLTNQYEELRGKYVKLTTEYNKLAENSIQLNERYAMTADKLVTLTQDYSRLAVEYDALVKKYRDIALRTSPREPLDVGLGTVTSNNTTHGIVMVGAGTHVFDVGVRAWLFGGQDNYGVILGTSF
jgi:predicted nuclease with TOPRIM domain